MMNRSFPASAGNELPTTGTIGRLWQRPQVFGICGSPEREEIVRTAANAEEGLTG